MCIDDNKLVEITDPKNFHFYFDLPKVIDRNLKHEVDYIIKQNGFLAEQRIKNKTDRLLSKYKHGNNIHGDRNK